MRPQAQDDCNTNCENVHILITIVIPMRLGRWLEIIKELSSLSLSLYIYIYIHVITIL